MGKHEFQELPEDENSSIYIVGDESGIYGLTYEPASQIKAALERELDAPVNEDVPISSRRLDPSGVTSMLDPAYLAGCALGLAELDDVERSKFIDPTDDDCDDELHD